MRLKFLFFFSLSILFEGNLAGKSNSKNAVQGGSTPKHLSGANSVVKAMSPHYYFIEACCMEKLPVNQACKNSLDRFHLVCKDHLGGHPGDCKRRASFLYYQHCSDVIKRKRNSQMQPYYGYNKGKVTIEGRRQDRPNRKRRLMEKQLGRRHSRMKNHGEMDKDLIERRLHHQFKGRRHHEEMGEDFGEAEGNGKKHRRPRRKRKHRSKRHVAAKL